MDELLSFLRAYPPALTNKRANVSDTPIRSTTIGLVNVRQQRAASLSRFAGKHDFELVRLVLGLLRDTRIRGDGPDSFTSFTVNVDAPMKLHKDGRNDGQSYVVAMGPFQGGELFVESPPGGCDHEEARVYTTESGETVSGTKVDPKNRWYRFDGAKTRHAVLPFTGGTRVSVVFFSVPSQTCRPDDLNVLANLGFPSPSPALCPYIIRICSTRRPGSISNHTLRQIGLDGSVPMSAVGLCLRDDVDRAAYAHLGLPMQVLDAPGGLPEQRALCTRHLPAGSWCLLVDDDITKIHCPEGWGLHLLTMAGFILAKQRVAHLWGLNTSANARCLRENVSDALGLINGHFYGLIAGRDCGKTPLSDNHGGAAEDVERSLRHYLDRGLVRLNWAAALAKHSNNPGGLQSFFGASQRAAAHKQVLGALATEFPDMLVLADSSPNGCKFLSTHKRRAKKDLHECDVCGKSYTRASDLNYHQLEHSDTPRPVFPCAHCGKEFRRAKNRAQHLKCGRCRPQIGQ